MQQTCDRASASCCFRVIGRKRKRTGGLKEILVCKLCTKLGEVEEVGTGPKRNKYCSHLPQALYDHAMLLLRMLKSSVNRNQRNDRRGVGEQKNSLVKQ